MPDPNRRKRFAAHWLPFVGAARQDLSALPARRPADQFWQFKDSALDAAESEEVVDAITDAIEEFESLYPESPVVELLLKELDAYRAAVAIARAEREASTSSEARKTLGRIGKTAIDSWREIFDKLPAHVKAVLKLLSEAFEIFAHD